MSDSWNPTYKEGDYFKANSIQYKLIDKIREELIFGNIIVYNTKVEVVNVSERESSGKEKEGDKMYLLVTELKEYNDTVDKLTENVIDKIKSGELLKDNDKIKEAINNNDELGMLSTFAENFQCRKLLNHITVENNDKKLYYFFFEYYEENTICIRDYMEIKDSQLSESETQIIIIKFFELLLRIYEAEIDYPKELIDEKYIYIQTDETKKKLKKDFTLTIDYFIFHTKYKSVGGSLAYMSRSKKEFFLMPNIIFQQSSYIWKLGKLCYFLLEGEYLSELTPFLKLKPFKEENSNNPKFPSMDCQNFLKYCLQRNPYKRSSFEKLKEFNFLNEKLIHIRNENSQESSMENKLKETSITGKSTFLYMSEEDILDNIQGWEEYSEKYQKKEFYGLKETITMHYAFSASLGEDHEKFDNEVERKIIRFFEEKEKEDINKIDKFIKPVLIPSYPEVD